MISHTWKTHKIAWIIQLPISATQNGVSKLEIIHKTKLWTYSILWLTQSEERYKGEIVQADLFERGQRVELPTKRYPSSLFRWSAYIGFLLHASGVIWRLLFWYEKRIFRRQPLVKGRVLCSPIQAARCSWEKGGVNCIIWSCTVPRQHSTLIKGDRGSK